MVSSYNPCPPESEIWTKPKTHPCSKQFSQISKQDLDSDYVNLLNTVQRHTQCSTKYCLRYKQDNKGPQCRFNYPYDICDNTKLVFKPIHSRDNTSQFKAKIVTKRNDARLNNH